VQTGANSSVGIGFPDGTALNLVANTRMALNDYSFDASSTSNSALLPSWATLPATKSRPRSRPWVSAAPPSISRP
jgi:hypothetical protein